MMSAPHFSSDSQSAEQDQATSQAQLERHAQSRAVAGRLLSLEEDGSVDMGPASEQSGGDGGIGAPPPELAEAYARIEQLQHQLELAQEERSALSLRLATSALEQEELEARLAETEDELEACQSHMEQQSRQLEQQTQQLAQHQRLIATAQRARQLRDSASQTASRWRSRSRRNSSGS